MDDKEIKYRFEEVHRKLQGATLANSRAAKLERELMSLRCLLDKGFDSTFVVKKLDELEKGIADYEIRVSGLEAGFTVLVDETSRAHARVTDIENVVAEDRKVTRSTARRLTVVEDYLSMGFPFAGALISIIIGVIVGVLWHHHDFSSAFAAGENELVRNGYDHPATAWAMGVASAAIAFGIILSIRRSLKRARVEEEEMKTEAQQVFDRHRTTVQAEEAAATTTTTTEVLPAQPVSSS